MFSEGYSSPNWASISLRMSSLPLGCSRWLTFAPLCLPVCLVPETFKHFDGSAKNSELLVKYRWFRYYFVREWFFQKEWKWKPKKTENTPALKSYIDIEPIRKTLDFSGRFSPLGRSLSHRNRSRSCMNPKCTQSFRSLRLGVQIQQSWTLEKKHVFRDFSFSAGDFNSLVWTLCLNTISTLRLICTWNWIVEENWFAELRAETRGAVQAFFFSVLFRLLNCFNIYKSERGIRLQVVWRKNAT